MVATAVSTRAPGGEIPALLGERRKILLIALPLLSGLCFASLPVIAELPKESHWEIAGFAVVGTVLALLAVLLKLRHIDYRPAAYATITLVGGLLLTRLVMMFASGLFEDPSRSFFMAVYAQYATFYLLIVLVLPYPQSARFGVAAWLAMATIATVGTHPYWHANPPRQLLSATLLYVWLGQGLFIALLFNWARQQQSLVKKHADLADVERAARLERDASNLRFQSIFDQAAAGIGLFGIDGRWLEVNARLCELLGYSAEELIGQPMTKVTPSEDHAAFRIRMQTLMNGLAPDYSVERRALHKHGHTIWLHAQMRRLATAEGQPAQGVLFVIDITERRLAQQKSNENETRYRSVFDQAAVGIALIDEYGLVLKANERMSDLTGFPVSELVGNHADLFTPLEDRAAFAARLGALRALEKEQHTVERRCLRKDGQIIWTSVHVCKIPATAELPAHSIFVMVDINDRKLAEQKVLETERLRHLHYENTPLAIVEWTTDLRVKAWSRRAEEIFGWSEAEVIGRSPFEWRFIHDEDMQSAHSTATALLRGDQPLIINLIRLYNLSGAVIWAHMYNSPLRDEFGNVKSFLSMISDVSEQQLASQALNESETRFRSMFERAATGMILIDEAGTLLSVNERTCEMFGYAASELIGISLEQFTPVEDRAEFTERMGSVETRLATLETEAKDGYSLERRCVRKDGAYFWVSVHVRKIAASAKFPAYAIATLIDITARKLAEQKAIEHQRVREFHFDNTPLAVIEWTPDLRVKRWSTRAEQMFGWSESGVIGKRAYEWHFIHEEDRDEMQRAATRLLSGSESLVATLTRNYHHDGMVVWCQWYHSVLRDESGTVISVFSMINDVSDQQFAIEALNKSETRLRSTFDQAAVGMSLLNADGSWHTVNQRLCEITGYTMSELLASDYQTITVPEDLSLDSERARQLIEGEIDSYNIEKRYVHKQGHVVWVKVFASRINATETQPPLYVAVVLDINERKQAELEIRQLTTGLENKVAERTEQLQNTMQSWQARNRELSLLAEMMSVLPAANDAAEGNRIVAGYLPRLFSRCGGAYYVKDETTQRLMLKVKWGDGGELRQSFEIDDCWALRRKQSLRVEDPADPLHCPHLGTGHHHGEQQPHACMPILALGDIAGMIHLHWQERGVVDNSPPDSVMLANAAEQIGLAVGNMRLREELRRQATRDPLTGLYNRRHFDEQLRLRIAEQARDPRGFAMLMVDLDHFKTINDRFGHDAGDVVLRETATLLQRAVRADEAVFRLGGEEFLILLANGSGAEAAGCGERVRRDIERLHIEHGGQPLPTITASIGVSCFPGDGCSGNALLKNADAALYVAKRTGRNRVCMASASLGPTPAAIAAVKSPPV